MRVTVIAVGVGVALLMAGCTPRQPRPLANYSPTVVRKNVDDLKGDVASELKKATYFEYESYKNIGRIGCYDWSMTRDFNSEGATINCSDPLHIGNDGTNRIYSAHIYHIYYDELADVSYSPQTCTDRTIPLPRGMKAFIPGLSPRVCDTFYSLGQAYKTQRDAEDAAFSAQAAHYRDTGARPMTEDMRRLIVQAEAARKRQDYTQAAELFGTALRHDPVAYPAGWFNLALLYEQQERYGRAINAMKRYLALQPTATDARAAQDKIYEWEGMSGGKR